MLTIGTKKKQLETYTKELTILTSIYDIWAKEIIENKLNKERDFWAILLFRTHIFWGFDWLKWSIKHSVRLTSEDKKLLLEYLQRLKNKFLYPLTDFERKLTRLMEIEVENQAFKEYLIKALLKEGILKEVKGKYHIVCKKITPPNYWVSEDTIIPLPESLLDIILLIPPDKYKQEDEIKNILWEYCQNILFKELKHHQLEDEIAKIKEKIVSKYYPHIYPNSNSIAVSFVF